jgi:hypothetical protein
MTGLEDLLRAATREKATAVTPESIPPLDVATLATARRYRWGRGRRPARFARWPRLAVPLASAVAVVAVVALSIALPRVLTGRGLLGGGGAGGNAGTSATADGGGSGSNAIPPYYVALTRMGSIDQVLPVEVTVRSTETGAALATVRAPAPWGTFRLVASGPDDDTFIVAAQRWSLSALGANDTTTDETLLLLHFNSATRSVTFSSLPVPPVVPGELQSVALSPDGSRLAVATQPSQHVLDLDVYSLTGGGVRIWSLTGAAAARWSVDIPDDSETGGNGANPNAMSWLPGGGTLAFDLAEFDGGQALTATVRELDVDGPGGGLLAGSRAVFTLDPRTASFECTDALQLSGDGATVACAGYESEAYAATAAKAGPPATASPSAQTGHEAGATYGFGVFSVVTGRLATVLAPTALGAPLQVDPRLFWRGAGDVLIGTLSGPAIVVSGNQVHITPGNVGDVPSYNFAIDAAW